MSIKNKFSLNTAVINIGLISTFICKVEVPAAKELSLNLLKSVVSGMFSRKKYSLGTLF